MKSRLSMPRSESLADQLSHPSRFSGQCLLQRLMTVATSTAVCVAGLTMTGVVTGLATGLTTGLTVSLTAMPARAADPFRSGEQARNIKTDTETVFRAIFQRGNYTEARQLLPQALRADRQEPLITTLAALLAYYDNDVVTMNRYALQTEQLGASLMLRDPLRGNLYQGVGKSIQAVFDVSDQGAGKVLGVPLALVKIQETLQFLSRAREINANDPELNLLQGYIEWALASGLGVISRDQARQRLEVAGPDYLALRGVALVLRDQKKFDDALVVVDRALVAAPEHPELLYLKAQILGGAKRPAEGLKVLEQALAKQDQLPKAIVSEMLGRQRSLQRALQSAK
jgi:tetratricopeptide (TPR) repeat protein